MIKSFSQLAKGVIALILTLAVVSPSMAGNSIDVYWVVPNVNGQVTISGSSSMQLGAMKNKALSEAGIQTKYSDDYEVIAGGCGVSLDESESLESLGITNGSLLNLSLGPKPCTRRSS